MITLKFYKSIHEKKYFCVLDILSTPFHKVFSIKNYQEAGEDMVRYLEEQVIREDLKKDLPTKFN